MPWIRYTGDAEHEHRSTTTQLASIRYTPVTPSTDQLTRTTLIRYTRDSPNIDQVTSRITKRYTGRGQQPALSELPDLAREQSTTTFNVLVATIHRWFPSNKKRTDRFTAGSVSVCRSGVGRSSLTLQPLMSSVASALSPTRLSMPSTVTMSSCAKESDVSETCHI